MQKKGLDDLHEMFGQNPCMAFYHWILKMYQHLDNCPDFHTTLESQCAPKFFDESHVL